MIIALDVDGVLADLITEWLLRYNKDSGDNLHPKDITKYEIEKFVKPGYEKSIFEFIEDGKIYGRVDPYPGAITMVNDLKKMGHRIIYVTTSPMPSSGKKYYWLLSYGFLGLREYHNYIEAKDKSLIRADILLDDHVKNVNDFLGMGVLLADKPWSKGHTGDVLNCVKSFREFLGFVGSF